MNLWSAEFAHRVVQFNCLSQFIWHIASPLKTFFLINIWAPISENTFWRVPSKVQISLHIDGLNRIFLGRILECQECNFLHVDNEDSDQTRQMCMLIWVLCACQTAHFLMLLIYSLGMEIKSEFQRIFFPHLEDCTLKGGNSFKTILLPS